MKKLLLILGMCLLLLPIVQAVNLTTNVYAHWGFSSGSLEDNVSSINFTNSGTTFRTTDCLIGTCAEFNGSEYVESPAQAGLDYDAETMNFWLKSPASLGDQDYVWYDIGYSDTFFSIRTGDVANWRLRAGTATEGSTVVRNDTWNMMTLVFKGSSGIELFINGVSEGTHTEGASTAENQAFRFGGVTTVTYEGRLDEISYWTKELNQTEINFLYSSERNGTGYPWTGAAPPAPPSSNSTNATEIFETTSEAMQISNVTITGGTWSTIISVDVEITNNTLAYIESTIPLVTVTGTPTAECRISIDGSYYDSTEERTLSSSGIGELILMTNNASLTAGNKTLELECRRSAAPGSFNVFNSEFIIHELVDDGGQPVNSKYESVSAAAINGTAIISTTFNTSNNQTDPGETRYLIAEYVASPSYSSTGNLTYTLDVAGNNCTSIVRFGSSGSIGSLGDQCAITVLNDTQYNINLYVAGSGTTDAKLHLKEFIVHEGEINSTTTNNLLITSTNSTLLDSIIITPNAGHTTGNVFVRAAVSTVGLNGSSTINLFLTNGTSNSTPVLRTINNSRPGVLVLEHIFNTVTAAQTYSVYGSCSVLNCSAVNISLMAYFTSADDVTPNSFTINASSVYGNASITNFDARIGNNTIVSAVNGIITVVTSDNNVNITIPGTNTTTIGYFPNITLNHNTAGDLSVTLREWTLINAYTPADVQINNFSVAYSANNITIGSATTTNGDAYIPLFNQSYNVTVYDAVADDLTEFANRTQAANASLYIREINFSMQVTNAILIQYFDANTNQQINVVTLDYFSAGGDSGNASTNNSQLLLSFLMPETYTLISDSSGYLQHFYSFTLLNQTFNNLNISLLNSSIGTLVTLTVKDSLDNSLEGYTVKILELDVISNTFITREIRTTNFEGITVAGLELNGPLYKFIVEKDGAVLLTTTETQIYANTLTLVVTLGSTGFEEVFTGVKLSGSVIFNNDTNICRFNYNDEANTASQGCLTIYRLDNAKTQVNQTCSASASGSINIAITNTTGSAWLCDGTIDDAGGRTFYIDSQIVTFGEILPDNGSSLLMMFLMILVFLSALSVSIEASVIAASIVPLMFTIMQLTKIDYTISIGILAAGLVVAYIIGVIKK